MEWLDPLLAWLSDHPGWLAAALFATALIESLAIAGVIVPGVALLFALATLAGNTGFSLTEALLWAAAGAIAGDGISFALGRLFSDRLHEVWPFTRYPSMIDNGERFFRRHGGKSVIIGRFVGPIRPVLPLIAGAFAMPTRRFFAFNLLSATGWAPAYILPGFLVGSAMTLSIEPPPYFYPTIGLSLAVLAALYAVIFRTHYQLLSDGWMYRYLATRAQRSPTVQRWWTGLSSRHRYDPEFPLASLSLAVGGICLFALWSLIATETHWLESIDRSLTVGLQAVRHPLIDQPFVLMSMLGDRGLLLSLLALAAVTFLIMRRPSAAIAILLAGLGTWALTIALKHGFDIPRPEIAASPPESPAYPSGHASGITVAAGLVGSFIAREYRRHRRWLVYSIASIPILLVSVSRVYLGVHWFSDVVGGILMGLTICGIARFAYSRYDQEPVRHRRTVTAAAILAAAWTVVYLSLHYEQSLLAVAPAGQ